MANVLIVAYLLIVLALIAVILLQRSEGGALGIGGGGGGGFMTARGSANLLTRTTAILATLFFATAIGLTILSELDRGSSGILERAAAGQEGEAPSSVLDALNQLGSGATTSDLPVPASDPVAPAGADPVTEDVVPAPAAEAAPAAETNSTPEASGDLPVPEAPATAPAETPAAPATN
ncbi:MAG: preprotein translocase subunit SecG [Candidatus Devosia phytovorans]|uniref:Protein-export membrane protein SecG n=1 Tax=Candidatus Devosia phytovorans TaxID=3121372 RepID=A0AAJ6B1N4_9HYPH|nr:preprotein translocase subunit SecG [Devosia sp.]WEK05946.1 MAG: preprotein translocase subunit SecG [Devosia sp.]